MGSNQIIAIALLILAAVLAYFGYAASQSIGDQVSQTLTGRFTDSTTWYFIFAVAAAVGGSLLLAVSGKR